MEGSKQNGLNDYAREVIRHKARQLIGKYGFTPDDYDDIRQEMALDLLTRLTKFDPARASVNTFVARVVDRRISTLIRHRQQEKRDYRREAWSLDEPVNNEDCAGATRGELLGQDECDLRAGKQTRPESERVDLSLDLSIAISELPPDLKHLAELLLTHTITQAAQELGVPRSTLYEKGIARLAEDVRGQGPARVPLQRTTDPQGAG